MSTTDPTLGTNEIADLWDPASAPEGMVSKSDGYYTLTDTGTDPASIILKRKTKSALIGLTPLLDVEVGRIQGNIYTNTKGNDLESEHWSKTSNISEVKTQARKSAQRDLLKNKNPKFPGSGNNSTSEIDKTLNEIFGINSSVTAESELNVDGFVLKNKVVATQRDEMAGKPGTHLVYPQDHADGDFDFIKIVPIEYVPQLGSSLSSGTNFRDLTRLKQRYKQRERVVGATMFLPMVPGISEGNSVDWGGERVNPLQLAAGAQAASAIGAFGDKLGGKGKPDQTWGELLASQANQMGATAQTMLRDNTLRDFIVSYFAGKAVNANLLGRAGIAVNPNLEVLFNGPALRTFTYNFRFTPRDDREAKTIRTIIKVIKKAMAPKRRKAGIFLQVPAVFKIKYLMRGHTEHPFLNKIKPCALTTFNVDYTPDQTYMTYQDGSLTSYAVGMTFAELEPIYNDDIEDVATQTTGY